MPQNYSLLQDPFWNALRTEQKDFALGTTRIMKFRSQVLPFMGLHSYDKSILPEIEPFLGPGEEVFVKDKFLSLPDNWEVIAHVPVIQMICKRPPVAPEKKVGIVRLGEADYPALFDLVNMVQPGYFRPQTHLLGNYYGIKLDGKLVAVAGERMKITGFIEVSAVCTLPEYTGRGLAQQLICFLCRQIFSQGKIPFLHVLETNTRAIRLYELLHFEKNMDFPLIKVKLVK